MPKFRLHMHEEISVDLCVEAPSQDAVTLWVENRDGKFADAMAASLPEQVILARYVDELTPWVTNDGNPGVVYEVDAEGKQVGKKET